MVVSQEINGKGVPEMEEECKKKLPPLLVQYCHAITSWLSAQMYKQNNQTSRSVVKKTKRNEAEMKQHNAAAILQKHH